MTEQVKRYRWTWKNGRYFVDAYEVNSCVMVMADDYDTLKLQVEKLRATVILARKNLHFLPAVVEEIDAALEATK